MNTLPQSRIRLNPNYSANNRLDIPKVATATAELASLITELVLLRVLIEIGTVD